MVQHLPIPVVLIDAAGVVVAASSPAASALHAKGDDHIHLADHLESLVGDRPTLDRSAIESDVGQHELVVLGVAHGASVPRDVATLAGEIAHDFNNLLGVIINYATLAASEAPAGSQQSHDLSEVLAASRRAATIADRLRRMSAADTLD